MVTFRRGWPFAAVVATVIFAYLPAISTRYAYSDDYPALWMSVTGRPDPWFGRSIVELHSAGGRPVGGALLEAAFVMAGTIDALRFVRFVAVLGIAALAALLQWWLVRNDMGARVAGLVAVSVCVMPVFAVVASWAVLFATPFAALLAAGASVVATGTAARRGRPLALRLLTSAALLLVALLIYQPPAMFFWVFFVIAVLGVRTDAPRVVHVVRAHAVVATMALVGAFVLGKLAAQLADSSAPATNRMTVTDDPLGKLQWFVQHPLYRALSLFRVHNTPGVAALCVALAVVGVAAYFVRGSARPRLTLAAAAAAIPLAFLPNLVVTESNSFVFRTGVALTSIVALYACLGVIAACSLLRERLTTRVDRPQVERLSRLAMAAFALAVGAIAYTASRTASELVADPQHDELRIARAAVASLPQDARRVQFVQIGWDEGLTTWRSDELGLASAARPWTGEPLVLLLLREQGRSLASMPRVDTIPPGQSPSSDPVIDVREGFRARRSVDGRQ